MATDNATVARTEGDSKRPLRSDTPARKKLLSDITAERPWRYDAMQPRINSLHLSLAASDALMGISGNA